MECPSSIFSMDVFNEDINLYLDGFSHVFFPMSGETHGFPVSHPFSHRFHGLAPDSKRFGLPVVDIFVDMVQAAAHTHRSPWMSTAEVIAEYNRN